MTLSARMLACAAASAGRADIREGVKKLKRKLKRARQRAVRRGRPADLHACRKRAKDLEYILEALDVSQASVRDFRKAADELGAARDLRLLMAKAKLRDAGLVKKARKLEAAALERL